MNCLLAANSYLTWQLVVLILGIMLILAAVVCFIIGIHKHYAADKKRRELDNHIRSLTDAFFYKKALIVKIKSSEYDVTFSDKSPHIELHEKAKKP